MKQIHPITSIEKPLNEYVYSDNECTKVKKDKELISENLFLLEPRFDEYTVNSESLEDIKAIEYDETLHDDLYHLYDSKEKLKKSIRDLSSTICPYCSTPESPFHVDHYLPRSDYPEFSVFTLNLIPACATCNSRYKGKKYLNDDKRKYLNPYFDKFIETLKFLECSLSVDKNYLVVEFFIDPSVEADHPYEYQIIKSHFDSLHLADRYTNLIINEVFKQFRDEYVETDDETRQPFFLNVTLEELKRDIEKKIRSFQSYNINYWEKVFFESLKECDDCLLLIVNKVIPLVSKQL